MTPDNRTEKRKLGDIGENIACEFLVKRGFRVIDRNYLRKWGEIDIIAEKDEILRFVEVKTVSRATQIKPEENVHPGKLRRIARACQTYLLERRIDKDWQIDVVTVRLDMKNHLAKCELIENIIL